MASYDDKAIKGGRLARLIRKITGRHQLDENVSAVALNDINARVAVLEEIVKSFGPDAWERYKTVQVAKSSPSASGTAVSFIDTISQNDNGDITATRKTVRSATTGQTGVVQLNNTVTSTSTTQAATANAVKTAYDEASAAYDKPSSGIPYADLASAVQASLDKADSALQTHQDISHKLTGVNMLIDSGYALNITISGELRTGRSTALVLISGNNGNYSLVELSWFKAANAQFGYLPSMHVIARSSDDAAACPQLYYQPGSEEYPAVAIYLVMGNASWTFNAAVMLNCENMGSVSISSISRDTVLQSAVDGSSRVTKNLQGGWDVIPTSGSTNAVTSNGIYASNQSLQTYIDNQIAYYRQRLGSWLYCSSANYIAFYDDGTALKSGTVITPLYIGQVVYEADLTRRLFIATAFTDVDNPRFAIFPGWTYCGENDGADIMRTWPMYRHYVITLTNTGSDTAKIYAIAGGRATTAQAGYICLGNLWIDGTLYQTDSQSSPNTWDVGYYNRQQVCSIPAGKSVTLDVWWYRSERTSSQYWDIDNVFITTIE